MVVKSWGTLIGAGAGMVIFLCLVGWFALRLIRGNRDQILADAPLSPEQQISIDEPGEVVLLLETPRLQMGYSGLRFMVTDQATGHATEMQYDYARAQGAVRGVSTIRVPFGRITVDRPTTLLVRVNGMEAGRSYSGSRILLSRPYLGRMTLQILGIVFCAVAALLCLILAAWQVFPPQPQR